LSNEGKKRDWGRELKEEISELKRGRRQGREAGL